MKKFGVLLLMLIGAVAFTACSDDDDDNGTIVGKWKYTGSIAKEVKTDNILVTAAITEELTETGSDSVVEFKSDGKVYYDDNTSASYEYSNGKLTVSYGSYSYVSSVTVVGDLMTATIDLTDEYDAEDFVDDFGPVTITKVIMVETYTRK